MLFDEYAYNTLVVSSSGKFNDAIRPHLAAANCSPITYVSGVAAAKRAVLDTQYDFVIINAPLPDDFGTKFAIDLCTGKNTVCLILVSADRLDEIHARVTSHGVFVLSKPISAPVLAHGLDFMAAMRERLRNLEQKTASVEQKMEEIRLVNRAKWMLIENLHMTEPDAHRYIEKQAMDTCVSRREVAESIIRTYN